MLSFYQPHPRLRVDVGVETMTEQSHKDACDINNIIKQFSITGILSHVSKMQGEFIHLPDAIDYQSSLAVISEAEATFDGLPAKVKEYFGFDVTQFLLAFESSDVEVRSKLREFGFLKPDQGGAPVVVQSALGD